MRISDWSSDVCSSDLSSSLGLFPLQMIAMRWPSGDQVAVPTVSPSLHGCIVRACLLCKFRIASSLVFSWEIRYSRRRQSGDQMEIGSASYRERVCQYV